MRGVARRKGVARGHPLLAGCLGWWWFEPLSDSCFQVQSLLAGATGKQANNSGDVFRRKVKGAGTVLNNRNPSGFIGLDFNDDGTGDRFTAGTNFADTVQDHSLALWAFYDNISSNTLMLASRASNITAGGYEWRGGNSKVGFAYFGGGVHGFYDGYSIPVQEWFHFVGTWDQAAGSVVFYKNGILTTTVATATNAITHNASDEFWWGYQSQNRPWSGHLDDFMFWNRVLRPAEVAELYRDALNGHPQLLAAHDEMLGSGAGATTGGLLQRRRRDEAAEPRPWYTW